MKKNHRKLRRGLFLGLLDAPTLQMTATMMLAVSLPHLLIRLVVLSRLRLHPGPNRLARAAQTPSILLANAALTVLAPLLLSCLQAQI